MNINSIFSSKSFYLGLFIRVIFIIFFVPIIHIDLFNNFIIHSIQNPSIDPWDSFLSNGGDPLSFPYGYIMLAFLSPLSFFGLIIGSIFNNSIYFSSLGLGLSFLLIDYSGLLIFSKIFPKNINEIISYYWLSPLLIYVTYFHGQLDLLPSLIMLCGFFCLMKRKFSLSGFVFGIACAAKLSMVLAIPFTLIYLWQNMRLRAAFRPFIFYFCLTTTFLSLIPSFLEGYRKMVLGTPLKNNIFWFSVSFDGFTIYILPIVFSILIYLMWRMLKTNYDLLVSFTGISFLISILMMPPNPGWYLWSLPFLIFYQIKTDLQGKFLISLFSIFSVILLYPLHSGSNNIIFKSFNIYNENSNNSFIYSIILFLGVIICLRWYRESIQKNDYFILSRRPLCIGISGSSQSGKKQLCNNLKDVFGESSVNHIDSNKYHKWSDYSPMRRTSSINDPLNFDLLKLSQILQLSKFNNFNELSNNNKFLRKLNFPSKRMDSIIICTGMHIFAADSLADKFDIKIFMDPALKLKKFWTEDSKNKVNDDYSKDSKKFKNIFLKQKKVSDIIFSIKPVNEDLNGKELLEKIPLKLKVYFSDAIFVDRLSKALISICGVKLDSQINYDNLSAIMTIEGEVWSGDIELLALHLIPNLEEFLDLKPKWQDDVFGIMQIIVLLQIDHTLNKVYLK
ncbi:hypothetical protein EU99_1806 [Prochlorococcus marinus str. MIT 9321]|uniref:Phosphoribulokinase n=1 Tax=Prochlorococcus marinus str. MIT 9401 TaxID=167551 RepID=A0A0A2B9G6_PROMR|nr:DUF2029 domain-containing protein [Prochlorococcus marinus]KGG02844.1 hypothetical protein EU99_1806 [Prochlorococcus marinus str. MIT 9321]KGG05467.1 hypothetical protein EV00_1101 [Prochlorococcus marinus str. MIT 9322]KGG10501.1 hypothetical protein EV01_0129 [Prochlorococcus marinus str. MIT 9401]